MVRRRASFAPAAALAFLVALLGSAAPPAAAAPASPEPLAWIVVDADTGKVLAAKDPHTALPPASTAKIMTALTAVERLAPDALVPVSELAASQPASKMTMLPGEQWPLAQVLASVLMVSANDAAYALAEAVGGNLEGFAAAANATAQRYGMKDSTLSDPAGRDDETSFQGGPRRSAYDIAIATRNALAIPQLAFFAALPETDFVDPSGVSRHLPNHNKLLAGNSAEYSGATGFKTGYTQQAGHTLVATASRDGRTIIAVILNTYDTYGWAWQLLDQGFATAPDAEGTGEVLPPVRVSPYAEREADQLAFVRLTKGDAAAIAAGSTTSSDAGTSTSVASTGGTAVGLAEPGASTSVATTGAGASSADAQGDESDGSSSTEKREKSSGGSVLSLRNFTFFLLAILATLVGLRRRSVKRQRARRIARRRATAEMMRRGGLPVVDGRYRTGTRVGPPVQSHVRVERADPR